jgi:hypothetical protein
MHLLYPFLNNLCKTDFAIFPLSYKKQKSKKARGNLGLSFLTFLHQEMLHIKTKNGKAMSISVE